MMFKYGRTSNQVLSELVPSLRKVAERGLEILSQSEDGCDVRLIDGLRTPEEAGQNAAKSVGIKLSKHLPDATGKSRAFDFVPLRFSDPWPRNADPAEVKKAKLDAFKVCIAAFLQAADELGIVARSGGDWDVDGIWTDVDPTEKKNIPDYPHIELVVSGELRYSACILARERRIAARVRGEKWPL